PSYLNWQVQRSLGRSFRFVELANDVNEHMPDYVVRRIQDLLNRQARAVNGSTVLLYGLAYKANTGDARETPTRPLVDQLLALGADVRLGDPHVPAHQFPEGATPVEGGSVDLEDADVIVYLVDHDEFDTELVSKSTTPVLDCRRALDGPQVHWL
ncbi:MAG: UDP binding domain-containing protein, partial [Microthrixaceae bacterium]